MGGLKFSEDVTVVEYLLSQEERQDKQQAFREHKRRQQQQQQGHPQRHPLGAPKFDLSASLHTCKRTATRHTMDTPSTPMVRFFARSNKKKTTAIVPSPVSLSSSTSSFASIQSSTTLDKPQSIPQVTAKKEDLEDRKVAIDTAQTEDEVEEEEAKEREEETVPAAMDEKRSRRRRNSDDEKLEVLQVVNVRRETLTVQEKQRRNKEQRKKLKKRQKKVMFNLNQIINQSNKRKVMSSYWEILSATFLLIQLITHLLMSICDYETGATPVSSPSPSSSSCSDASRGAAIVTSTMSSKSCTSPTLKSQD